MRTGAFALGLAALVACGEVKPLDDDICRKPGVECTCALETEATDCAEPHQACNVTTTGRTCDCVAGYAMGPSGCVWTGSLMDPGFASATTWTVGNGALLNTTAAGGVDPGEVSYVGSALCGLGVVKQTFDMPTFARAEPLVVEISYKNQIVSGQGGSDGAPMGVSLGDGWASLPAFNDALFHTVRVCLGESGYGPAGTTGKGAPVTLTLGPYDRPLRCPNTLISNFAIDHAAIVVPNAGECGATPGIAANNDAEGTGGWTFTTGGSGSSSGGFIPGIGANGSRAARLTLNQRCDSASMSTAISVPHVANPALDMFAGVAPSGALGSLSIGSSAVGLGALPLRLPPPGTGNYHVCLPPSLSGQTTTLTFTLRNGASGSCADVLNYQVWADNVKVVDDPTCMTTANLIDVGFERTGTLAGAFVNSTYAVPGPDGAVAIRSTAGQAHGGTGYLQIDSFANCSSQGLTTLVVVPPAGAGAGPALKFFAKASVNADATVTAAAGPTRLTLTQGNGYQPYTLCLSPLFAGRPQAVTFSSSVTTIGVACGSVDNQSTQIDDLQATTDPACPAL